MKAFEALASDGRPFFAYRLPGEGSVHLGTGDIIRADDYDGCTEAFVVAPFDPSEPAKLIIPQVGFETPCARSGELPGITLTDRDTPSESYSRAIGRLVERLAERGGKTVVSRVIRGRCHALPVARLFHRLCSEYPGSYIYCWRTEGDSFWVGAVPELLLEVRGNIVRSMALAGTMRTDDHSPWSGKNIEEQQFVTDFIARQFEEYGLTDLTVGSPADRTAGPVKHLCTMIEARWHDSGFDCLGFARKLSPTPAVCGIPREESLREIASIESHDRRYYGGYSGPLKGRRNCRLYVTLRCMEADPEAGTIDIYVGGGITSKSVAAEEWAETLMKAETLVSLFNDPSPGPHIRCKG